MRSAMQRRQFVLPDRLHKALKKEAVESKRSASEIMRQMLEYRYPYTKQGAKPAVSVQQSQKKASTTSESKEMPLNEAFPVFEACFDAEICKRAEALFARLNMEVRV